MDALVEGLAAAAGAGPSRPPTSGAGYPGASAAGADFRCALGSAPPACLSRANVDSRVSFMPDCQGVWMRDLQSTALHAKQAAAKTRWLCLQRKAAAEEGCQGRRRQSAQGGQGGC